LSGTQVKSFIQEIEADRLIQNGDYEEAVLVLQNALESPHYPNREALINQLTICYLELRRFSDAIKILQEALKLNPENSTVLYHLGLSYFSQQNYTDAIPCFKKLIELEGYSEDNFYHLGLALLYCNQTEESLKYLNQIVDVQNSKSMRPDLVYDIGIHLIQADKPVHAKELFIRYLKIAENDIDATFGLGIAYSELRDYYRALECFNRIQKWAPERFPSLQVMIGVSQYKIGNIQLALDALEDSVEQNQQDYEPHYYLGVIYDELNYPEKAIRYLKTASNLNRKSVETLEKLGAIYLKLKKNEEARMTYKKLLKITGKGKYAYQIANLYFLKENYQEALKYYTLANTEVSINNINYNIGMCYFNLQQFNQSIPYLESSLTTMHDEWVFFMLGSAYLKTEQYDLALENLLKSYDINPKHLPTLYNTGILYANLANYKEADIWFDRYLSLSENPDVLYAKALSSFKLGNKDSAIKFFTKTIQTKMESPELLYKVALYLIQLKAKKQASLALKQVLQLVPEHQKAKEYLDELEE